MDEIKTEYSLMCHGCLCNDRQISPLGDSSEIFQSLVGNQKQCLIYGTDDIKLCWECLAKIKNFKIFQAQLKKAQDVLVQFLYGLETKPVTLSTLSTTTTKCYYDYDVQQENATKRKERNKNATDDIKKDLSKKWEIKVEIESDENQVISDNHNIALDDSKTDNHDDGDKKVYSDDFADDIGDNGFDNDTEFKNEYKIEAVKSEKKKSKIKKKVSRKIRWTYAKLYKEYATLIEKKQVDWGDIRSYFTTLYFDQSEMEQHIFVKERNYTDYSRYQFSCRACKLGYKSKTDLKRHNNLTHCKPDPPYKCSFCHKVVHSLTDLEKHWRGHSPIAKCNLCCHLLRPRGMKQHLNLAHTKRYACGYCRMTFETLSAFGTHFRDTHMKFTCDYCNKSFKSKTRIAYHIRNMHVPAYCTDCDRSYLNRSQYLKHCVLLHPQRANRSEEPSEACFCVECDKQFRSVAQYRKHLKVSTKHTEIKRTTTPCPECGKIFARKLYMKNHYNLYHLKKTKFYCELCDKYFARAFGLRVHNKHVHQKVQRVRDKICDLCGRAFSNNRTMLNHRRTHTGERPHKCPYCTAEFIQKYAMQTHMRTQHKHFT